MKRYIDVDALIERIKRDVVTLSPDAAEAKEFMLDHLDMERFVPTADVVEVVRCRDCKHLEIDDEGFTYCCASTGLDGKLPNDYCSRGERREENEG